MKYIEIARLCDSNIKYEDIKETVDIVASLMIQIMFNTFSHSKER